MTGGIFLVRDDGELVPMSEAPYDSEDRLQALLAHHPALLSGDAAGSDQGRWLLVKRECPIASEADGGGRWSVDHLFLDSAGVPTLVEVKRSSDTRIRREVVGQMLDYAANAVVYWPLEKIRAEFEGTCEAAGEDPTAALELFLREEGVDVEAFWLQVKTNLQAGRIRMLFVADVISPELARIVEFLNAQMDPAEVYALELRQYIGEGARTLVPRVIGQTADAQQRKGSGKRQQRQWDEEAFFEELTRRHPDAAPIARSLLDWANQQNLRVWWGRGAVDGSFFPLLDLEDTHWTFSVWTYARIEIQFEMMLNRPVFSDGAMRTELLSRLRDCQLPNVTFPDDSLTRRPSFPLSALGEEEKLAAFLEVMEWYLAELNSAAASGKG